MVVHLATAVAFDGNVGHALSLYFFFVLYFPCSLSLSPFLRDYLRMFGAVGLVKCDLWLSPREQGVLFFAY